MIRILSLLALVGLVAACGGSSSSSTRIRKGSGPEATPGHYVYVTFRYFKTPTRVLSDSKNATLTPALEIVEGAPTNSMNYFVKGKQIGDSLMFKIQAREYYKNDDGFVRLPEGVNSSDMITFHMRLDSMVTKEVYDARADERDARLADAGRIRLQNKLYETRVYYEEVLDREGVREQIAKEGKMIDAEIAKRGELAFKTANGVRMVIVEEELGDLIAPGDIVSVWYTGTLLDGTYFDSNRKEVVRANDDLDPNRTYTPFRFQLGIHEVIIGWDEAFKTLSAGTKVILYVPSPLAYGAQGTDGIPPNSPLRFDIEIIGAEKPF